MTAKELIDILSKNPEREVFVADKVLKTIASVYIDDAPFRLESYAEKRPWFIEIGADAKPITQNVALAKINEISEVIGEVFKGKGKS